MIPRTHRIALCLLVSNLSLVAAVRIFSCHPDHRLEGWGFLAVWNIFALLAWLEARRP